MNYNDYLNQAIAQQNVQQQALWPYGLLGSNLAQASNQVPQKPNENKVLLLLEDE
jgi:hypothetical protein